MKVTWNPTHLEVTTRWLVHFLPLYFLDTKDFWRSGLGAGMIEGALRAESTAGSIRLFDRESQKQEEIEEDGGRDGGPDQRRA